MEGGEFEKPSTCEEKKSNLGNLGKFGLLGRRGLYSNKLGKVLK